MRYRALGLPGPALGRRDRDLRGAGGPTHVGILELELHLPHCHSLKDKRAVLRPIIDGAHRRFKVAAAEVSFQDKWQRATLGFASVSSSARHADDVLEHVERFVISFPEVELLERRWGTSA